MAQAQGAAEAKEVAPALKGVVLAQEKGEGQAVDPAQGRAVAHSQSVHARIPHTWHLLVPVEVLRQLRLASLLHNPPSLQI